MNRHCPQQHVFSTSTLGHGALRDASVEEGWAEYQTNFALSSEAFSPTLRIGLATGFLGGFTTYSAFSEETFAFLQSGAWGVAVAYAAATVIGCLAACLAGQGAARWALGG